MLFTLFMLAAIALVGYAMFTQYQHTDPAVSVPRRVWASLAMAVGALMASLGAWLHSGSTTP